MSNRGLTQLCCECLTSFWMSDNTFPPPKYADSLGFLLEQLTNGGKERACRKRKPNPKREILLKNLRRRWKAGYSSERGCLRRD